MPKIEISDLSVDYKTSHGDIHALENILNFNWKMANQLE